MKKLERTRMIELSEEEKKAIEIIKQEITKPETIPLEVYVTDIKMLLHIIDKQQKEIEREKQYTDFYKDLCDKIQKELENNKKFKKDIVNMIMLWDKKELPENNAILETLKTIMHEFSRLEDIEDEKIQVAVEFVEEKRDKYWKDKIRKEIKKLEELRRYLTIKKHLITANGMIEISVCIDVLEKLLKENNND